MDEEKLKEKLLEWDETLKPFARKCHDEGNNELYQFNMGALSMIREIIKFMEEENGQDN